jgi:uncharacterized protein YbjT (DUF2867 family)
MSAFLVTGATGRQGGSTARELLKAGVKVHALVRNPQSDAAKEIQSLGAILFKGDAADTTSITQALEGVTGVFFNPPSPGEVTLSTTIEFIETCAAQPNVSTFVLSSTSGTEKHAEMMQKDPSYPERQKKFLGYWSLKSGTEDAARKAGFKNLVILRASLLHHIFTPPDCEALFPSLWSEKKLVTALKEDTKVPHLLAEDVGRFAAAALLDPTKFNGKEINLAAENLTSAELAGIFSDVTGANIQAFVPEFDGFEAIGVDYPLVGYHEWTNEIDASVDVAALKEYGIELTTMRQFLGEHNAELLKALNG